METWLHSNIPNNVIDLTGRYTLRADRTADDSGKTRGGGLCIYVNKAWCTNSDIVGRHCSPNLEFLMVKCRPFYLPREFTSTIITAAYIPPDVNAKLAMNGLHAAISKQQHWFGSTHARLLAPTAFLDVCSGHVQSSLQGSSQTFSTCPSPKQLCQHALSPHPLCQCRNTPPNMPEWLPSRSTHTHCYEVLWATGPGTPQ